MGTRGKTIFVCGALLGLCLVCPGSGQTSGPAQPEQRPVRGDEPVRAPEASFSLDFVFVPFRSGPSLRGSSSDSTELALPRRTRPAAGIVMSLPAIKNNHLRFSYFQMTGSSDTTAAGALTLFSKSFEPGDLLTTGYKIQTGKISLDYLSYPFPPEGAPFRLKTLWEVQVTGFRTSIEAPLKPETAAATSGRAVGTLWFAYPTFGLGVEQFRSERFRWEAKFSGFGVPGHAATWDAEAKAGYRQGQWELQFGFKGFYFRTSPKKEESVRAMLPGLYVGLRWYPK